MKKFTLKKKPEPFEPIEGFPPELETVRIRIHSETDPNSGTIYFEGSIRKFIQERIPSPALIQLLPQLVNESSIAYRLSAETIHITRMDTL